MPGKKNTPAAAAAAAAAATVNPPVDNFDGESEREEPNKLTRKKKGLWVGAENVLGFGIFGWGGGTEKEDDEGIKGDVEKEGIKDDVVVWARGWANSSWPRMDINYRVCGKY